jgi:signal peptide peptidase SppA
MMDDERRPWGAVLFWTHRAAEAQTMIRVLSRITTEPWAITRGALETIVEIAQRENATPQAVAERLGRPLEHSYAVEVRDGIAILPVAGPLFRYANLFTDISGATSYDRLARDFARAIDDRRIDAVVLNIDSPGGEANGVSEFADQIHRARGRKPIVAYVDGNAASAAYWIASAADEVVIADTAMVGSIGTVMAVHDTRQRDEKAGVREFAIVSSQSPHKRLDPATDEGQRRLQTRVDALAAVFIAKVALYRGVAPARVASEYGGGDVLVGAAAVAAGLADRISHFEAVIAELQAGVVAPVSRPAIEERTMSATTVSELAPVPAAGLAAPMASATGTADAAEAEAARADGAHEARTQERARIRTILTCAEAAERTALALQLALDTELDAATAAKVLAAAPPGTSAAFARLDAWMRQDGNPTVGADTEPRDGEDASVALIQTARAMGLAK